MTREPDAIRDDIERTRNALGRDVDAVADKVTPSKVVGRQTDKVKAAVRDISDHVMGAAGQAKDSVTSGVDGVSDAAHGVADKAKGNPLAVGLIALGVGWLASSLFSATPAEHRALDKAKDAAAPLADELGDIARESVEHLKEPAHDSAEALKESAADSFENVKDEANHAKEDVTQAANR